jgi:hypothetical protein
MAEGGDVANLMMERSRRRTFMDMAPDRLEEDIDRMVLAQVINEKETINCERIVASFFSSSSFSSYVIIRQGSTITQQGMRSGASSALVVFATSRQT